MYLCIQVSGFVAALRLFFTYGITIRPQLTCPVNCHKEKKHGLNNLKSPLEEPKRAEHGPYRPPHLRTRDSSNKKQTRACHSQSFSDYDSSPLSSDSDFSDTDISIKDTDSVEKAKVRVAAIGCIQVIYYFIFWFLIFFTLFQLIKLNIYYIYFCLCLSLV